MSEHPRTDTRGIDAKIVILGKSGQFPLFFCTGHSASLAFFPLAPQVWGKPVCWNGIPRTSSTGKT